MLIGVKNTDSLLSFVEVDCLELEDMQSYVGGSIEIVYPPNINESVSTFINEEGKLLGLEPNLKYYSSDVLCGNVLFVKYDDEGCITSLDYDDCQEITNYVVNNSLNGFEKIQYSELISRMF